jgi:hypothetical protein
MKRFKLLVWRKEYVSYGISQEKFRKLSETEKRELDSFVNASIAFKKQAREAKWNGYYE